MSTEPTLVFEQPLNERTRIFLRVEHLTMSALHCMRGSHWWDSRNFLVALDDLIGLLERCEIRTELHKDLDRQRKALQKLHELPSVDNYRVDKTLKDIDEAKAILEQTTGKIAQILRQNEFLNAIRQRLAVPGGSCSFDIPAYHQWLSMPYEKREADMREWLKEFYPITQAIDTVLRNMRHSAYAFEVTATKGYFQHDLDPKLPCHMIRLTVPQKSPIYPEISANKHRLNIRFIENLVKGHSEKVEEDIPFVLTCCTL